MVRISYRRLNMLLYFDHVASPDVRVALESWSPTVHSPLETLVVTTLRPALSFEI